MKPENAITSMPMDISNLALQDAQSRIMEDLPDNHFALRFEARVARGNVPFIADLLTEKQIPLLIAKDYDLDEWALICWAYYEGGQTERRVFWSAGA